jgi:superfamily I DNA/RNA helicase
MAAAELKERIHASCRERLENIAGLANMCVGTIHYFCLELLRAEVPECGCELKSDPTRLAGLKSNAPVAP